MLRVWQTTSSAGPYEALTVWQGIKSKVMVVSFFKLFKLCWGVLCLAFSVYLQCSEREQGQVFGRGGGVFFPGLFNAGLS